MNVLDSAVADLEAKHRAGALMLEVIAESDLTPAQRRQLVEGLRRRGLLQQHRKPGGD